MTDHLLNLADDIRRLIGQALIFAAIVTIPKTGGGEVATRLMKSASDALV